MVKQENLRYKWPTLFPRLRSTVKRGCKNSQTISNLLYIMSICLSAAAPRWCVGIAGSWDSFCFHCVNQQFISRRFVQKVIVSSRSGPSTYSFLSEPSRQPLLNHGSPLWQRAQTAAFTLTSNQINVWSIMGLLPSGQLWICKNYSLWYPLAAYILDCCVCVCVCMHRVIELKRVPIPLGSFPSGFICYLTKLGDFDIY